MPSEEYVSAVNTYAEPEGYSGPTAPIMYRIREAFLPDGYPKNAEGKDRYMLRDNPAIPEYYLGAVVERQTDVQEDPWNHQWYHSFDYRDRLYSDLVTGLVQQVCAYFYAPDETYEPMQGAPDFTVSDEEVAARILRLDKGENTREAERTHEGRYELVDLPPDQQRALVERIEELKARFRFEIIGPVPDYMLPAERAEVDWGGLST